MKLLLIIAGVGVYATNALDQLFFTGPAMIDGDGSGSSHGDPDYQPNTSLRLDGKSLNADLDRYIVLPPQVIKAVPGIVLGCKAVVLNTLTKQITDAVVGDVGPTTKLGEISISLAEAIGVPSSPTIGGESRPIVQYSIWPGIPAIVQGKDYNLQRS